MRWRPSEQLDEGDIQGVLLNPYPGLAYASYLLLRILDAGRAREWLAGLDITPAGGRQDGPCVNVAFSYPGLEALGVPDEALATFPTAFRQGMASPRRSRILGDTEPDTEPAHWKWGRPGDEPHVLLMRFASDPNEVEVDWELDGAMAVVWELRGKSDPNSTEHFGFVDGVSQPAIRGTEAATKIRARSRRETRLSLVEPGEFILGYRDNFGQRAPDVVVSDPDATLPRVRGARQDAGSLTRNGSFLAARQLEQHVERFRKCLAHATAPDPAAAGELAAKFVGRQQDRRPLVEPGRGGDNDFGFADDPAGLRCPIGAHIRRANPRDSLQVKWWSPRSRWTSVRTVNRHRLLRRGRPYGPRIIDNPKSWEEHGCAGEQGLFFLCLNSDLERQFEFVQQTWINDPSFGGLRHEPDAVVADPVVSSSDGAVFTEPQDPLRRRVYDLQRFVTVRGGAYFFLPGLRALRYLSDRAQPGQPGGKSR